MEPYNAVQGLHLPVLIQRSLDLIGPFSPLYKYTAPLALVLIRPLGALHSR